MTDEGAPPPPVQRCPEGFYATHSRRFHEDLVARFDVEVLDGTICRISAADWYDELQRRIAWRFEHEAAPRRLHLESVAVSRFSSGAPQPVALAPIDARQGCGALARLERNVLEGGGLVVPPLCDDVCRLPLYKSALPAELRRFAACLPLSHLMWRQQPDTAADGRVRVPDDSPLYAFLYWRRPGVLRQPDCELAPRRVDDEKNGVPRAMLMPQRAYAQHVEQMRAFFLRELGHVDVDQLQWCRLRGVEEGAPQTPLVRHGGGEDAPSSPYAVEVHLDVAFAIFDVAEHLDQTQR
jgi:hypothetical protein